MEAKVKPETAYRALIDKHLSKHFEIYPEVYSLCGKRIDYILRCQKTKAVFGLEVKKNHQTEEKLRGIDWANYLLQASAYSKMEWKVPFQKEPLKVMVFIAPSMSKFYKEVEVSSLFYYQDMECYPVKHRQNHTHSNMNSFISTAFNVGEVRKLVYESGYQYYAFVFNNKVIWENRYGLHTANYQFYTSKL